MAKLDVTIHGQMVQGVILDGGLGVNVVSKYMAQSLEICWEPLPFNIRMADNHTVVLKGVVKSEKMQITGIEYRVNPIVLAMKNLTADAYQMLLGWPWMRDEKVKHDWKRDQIILKKKEKEKSNYN